MINGKGNLEERVMANGSIQKIKAPAFLILDGMQRTPDPALQLDAMALTFVLICQSTNIDPHRLITRAKRQSRDSDVIPNPHLDAIRDYAVGEMQ